MRLSWVIVLAVGLVAGDAAAEPATKPSRREAIRELVGRLARKATTRQAEQWGLQLPATLDPGRPLVVLVHGLNSDEDCWRDLAPLLRERHPKLDVRLITHSMGGLIARSYVEGPEYGGGVSRMILIAPPNHGSGWARLDWVGEVGEHARLIRRGGWRWSWPVTDGLGEAGRDLMPDSECLRKLNARPRRAGVRYTIIAGNKHPVRRMFEKPFRDDPPLRQPAALFGPADVLQALACWNHRLQEKTGQTDGVVKLDSAQLEGVADFVVVPADHVSILRSAKNTQPPCWESVKRRLR